MWHEAGPATASQRWDDPADGGSGPTGDTGCLSFCRHPDVHHAGGAADTGGRRAVELDLDEGGGTSLGGVPPPMGWVGGGNVPNS